MNTNSPLPWRELRPAVGGWALLVVLTVITVTGRAESGSTLAIALIAGLTTLKVAWVVHGFMEVRHAPLWLQAACTAWIIAAIGATTLLLIAPTWSTDVVHRIEQLLPHLGRTPSG